MSQILIQRRVAAAGIPAASALRQWATQALGAVAGDVTLRLVDEAESRDLNHRYRGKDRPTNVLSFPYDTEGLDAPILGDVVICAEVVAREAGEQGKALRAHWAHMVVHGCLHLLGYDHENDRDAGEMEARETRLLGEMGFADPYAEDTGGHEAASDEF